MHRCASAVSALSNSLAASRRSGSIAPVMTAASIGAAKAGGYARYLESKTIEPERGDYYLSPTGEPTQAPGRWLASPDTLARLGHRGAERRGPRLHRADGGQAPAKRRLASPRGRRRRSRRRDRPDLQRAEVGLGACGRSATSAAREIEAAHANAVERGDGPPARERRRPCAAASGHVIEEPAADLIAAEYRHTTARGVIDGEAPDPQLHSHVVVTSAVREDGRIVAVASRPLFRSAREVGAYYRSALAQELQLARLRDRARHRQAGPLLRDRRRAALGCSSAFSARSREVARAAERFRAEVRPRTRARRAARAEAREPQGEGARHEGRPAARLERDRRAPRLRRRSPRVRRACRSTRRESALEDRVEQRLTERAATFEPRASCARSRSSSQPASSRPSERARANADDDRRAARAAARGRADDDADRSRSRAGDRAPVLQSSPSRRTRCRRAVARRRPRALVRERIGAPLSRGAAAARCESITGPERGAVLVGPAGTGKGVVIDAAAQRRAARRRRGVRRRGRRLHSAAPRPGQPRARRADADARRARLPRRARPARARRSARPSTSTRPAWRTPRASIA